MKYRCNGINKCGKRCKLKRKRVDFCKIHENQKDECSVCLQSIKIKKTIECEHTFCKDCILKWVCLRGNCPLCRSVVTDSTVKLDSVNFGVKNKLLVIIERYNLNISDLDESEQTLLSIFGIEPTLCMYEEDWNNTKSYISEELLEKIKKVFSYTIMKVDNEYEWDYYTKFNKIFLFD